MRTVFAVPVMDQIDAEIDAAIAASQTITAIYLTPVEWEEVGKSTLVTSQPADNPVGNIYIYRDTELRPDFEEGTSSEFQRHSRNITYSPTF